MATRGESDRIEVRGLRALGHIGLLPEELVRAQPYEVDFDVHADTSVAGASDDLHDTLDYGALVLAVHRVVTEERHDLLERAAARIAEELLAEPRAEAVTVTIRKLRPPVPVDVATAGVTIHRTRG